MTCILFHISTREYAELVQLIITCQKFPTLFFLLLFICWMLLHCAMLMEGRNEVANGWPLGLIGIMNSRIRVADVAAAPLPQLYASRILRSSSFSSFTSSNLDTESTESFFPDQSVSLGRLIGIGPANKGRLYGHHRHHHRRITDERSHPRVQKCHKNSQGLCAPLINHVIGKMGRSASSKR